LDNSIVSIILPVYNGQDYLSKSIESCLNQSYTNIELIIVNDCSTDNSLEIAQKYAQIDHRVKVINNKENKKLPASLNIGHREANGNFLTWTSHDNLYANDAINSMYNSIIDNNVDIVYSNYFLINSKGDIVGEQNLSNFENIFFGNVIGACFLYKKDVFLRNTGYNENFFLIEDYDFWLRSTKHSTFFNLNAYLYFYRVHDNSLTNSIKKKATENTIWAKNILLMFNQFISTLHINKKEELALFLSNALTYKSYNSDWIYDNYEIIKNFKTEILNLKSKPDKDKFNRVIIENSILWLAEDIQKGKIKPALYLLKNHFKYLKSKHIKRVIKNYLNI
jgi:glycosyltransferase involved in cell wall biosynthesis